MEGADKRPDSTDARLEKNNSQSPNLLVSQSPCLPVSLPPNVPVTLSRHLRSSLAGGILVLLVCLGVAWFLLPPQALWSPDEGAKLLQVQNLRLQGGRLDMAISYTGHDLDPTLRFAQPTPDGLLRVRDGALFLQRLPFFPLLVLPLFRWLGAPGLYVLPAFGAAASSVLTLHLVPRHERRLGMWLLVAFGSPLFVYGTIFWEHTLATSVGLAGAWIALQVAARSENNVSPRWLAWISCGAVLAISIYLRLELLLFAAALFAACWLALPRERWGVVWAGVTLGLLLLPYIPLHRMLFGQPVADNALYLFYPFTYLRVAGWRAVSDLLIGPFDEGAIYPGWMGALWAGTAVVALVASLAPRSWTAAHILVWFALAITTVAATAFLMTRVPYRSAHGLLFTTPWALLGLCRAREIWRRGSAAARVVVLAALFGLAAYVIGIIVLRASSPQGGLEWGARFALTFYPLLAIMAAWDLGPQHKAVFLPALLSVLICLGIGFQLRGIATIGQDKAINAALNEALVTVPEHAVVSDMPWLALNTAPIYRQKATFEIPFAAGISAWVEQAAGHGVKDFCLVTLNGQLVNSVNTLLRGIHLTVVEARAVGNIQILRIAIRSDTEIR